VAARKMDGARVLECDNRIKGIRVQANFEFSLLKLRALM